MRLTSFALRRDRGGHLARPHTWWATSGRGLRLAGASTALATTVLLLLAPGALHAQGDKEKTAAFTALAGADVDATDAAPVALAPWPGGPPGLLAVAALEDADGNDSADTLGALRVGLVTRQGDHFELVASDRDADPPEPSRTITPSVPDVGIDRAVFRISPHEVAIGVDVSETLTTTSTTAEASSLVLYRRLGAVLVPIFSAGPADSVTDKTGSRPRETATRHTVRVTSHMTGGVYDLELAKTRARGGRTYVWNGKRYTPTREPRGLTWQPLPVGERARSPGGGD